jgi:hypothetical protein
MSTPAPQINVRYPHQVSSVTAQVMNPFFYHSELSVENYHSFSDATMDTLLESLEELLDGLGNPNYEVEYHVRASIFQRAL